MSADAIGAGALASPRDPRARFDRLTTACVAVVALGVICAVAAPLLAPQDPAAVDPTLVLQGPSGAHLLGTDAVGRDLLSRLLYGARTTLLGPTVVVAVAAVVGTTLGIVSAWVGGVFDALLSRVLDILFAIPSVILAVLAVAMFGQGLTAPGFALCIAYTPYLARIVRSGCLRERNLPHVEALWIQGLSARAICIRHLLPSLLPMVLVQSALTFGYAMSDLAAIDFLGLGVQPPTADWGLMVAEGQDAVLQGSPVQSICAGLLIVVMVVAFNVLGERLASRWAVSDR